MRVDNKSIEQERTRLLVDAGYLSPWVYCEMFGSDDDLAPAIEPDEAKQDPVMLMMSI